MRKEASWSIVWGFIAALLFSQSGNAADYVIDPSRSEVVVQLFKTGIGSALAHDHVVRATKYSGQARLDLAEPAAARISVEVDATALVVDEPEIRKKYDLPLGLSEDSRQDIQRTLESESQLDVRRYPAIRFRSTRVTAEGEGSYLVNGDLELRGVTRPISLSLRGSAQNAELHVVGSGRFLQSSYGYQPYSAFWGAVQNQDEVVLHVDIVAVSQ